MEVGSEVSTLFVLSNFQFSQTFTHTYIHSNIRSLVGIAG